MAGDGAPGGNSGDPSSPRREASGQCIRVCVVEVDAAPPDLIQPRTAARCVCAFAPPVPGHGGAHVKRPPTRDRTGPSCSSALSKQPL